MFQMTKVIASLVLAASVLAAGAAQAAPRYGNALSESAHTHTITPHGVFDIR